MNKLILAICVLFLTACSLHSIGPNYNKGCNHNETKENRMAIVYKEDARMKKAMIRVRKSAGRYKKRKTNNNLRRIIK